jgi:hypothetical protein
MDDDLSDNNDLSGRKLPFQWKMPFLILICPNEQVNKAECVSAWSSTRGPKESTPKYICPTGPVSSVQCPVSISGVITSPVILARGVVRLIEVPCPCRAVQPGIHAVQCSAVQCSLLSMPCSAVQCSAVQCRQCSAVQCSAVQCSAVQCSAMQCSAVQCSAAQCELQGMVPPRWVLQDTTLPASCALCSVLQCTALYCSVLQCTALYCSVLYFTALY